jgi:peptide-methionine (S)-S-oxide reductase
MTTTRCPARRGTTMSVSRGLRAVLCVAAVGTGLHVDRTPARADAGEPGYLVLPMPLVPMPAPGSGAAPPSVQTAIFAGGCFWGIQGLFQHVRGVSRTLAGYDGGRADTARYDTVGTGTTGHAESVKIVFDPRQVSYADLLRIFFSVALDPTQVDRQFPDVGTQYRSVLFTTTPAQRVVAMAYIAQLNGLHVFARPIATEVRPDPGFYAAEAHHQNYLIRFPDNGYIATYDMPKIDALHALFPDNYRGDPVPDLASGAP